MSKLIYAEPDDEITNLVDRLRSEKSEKELVFVLPGASRVMHSNLNARLQEVLNPASAVGGKGVGQIERYGWTFRVGDKAGPVQKGADVRKRKENRLISASSTRSTRANLYVQLPMTEALKR